MRRFTTIGLLLGALGGLALAAFGEEQATSAVALFEKSCGSCHGVDRARSKHKTAEEWAATVKRMRANGAVLTEEQAKDIVTYLSENHGK